MLSILPISYKPNTKEEADYYFKIEVTIFEVEKLIGIAESVIKEIYLTAFEAGTDMSTIIFDRSNFEIVRMLAEESEKELKRYLPLTLKLRNNTQSTPRCRWRPRQ